MLLSLPDGVVIPDLDDRGLRKFALTLSIVIVALFWLLVPWAFETNRPLWPWIVAVLLGLIGVTMPSRLRGVYQAWMMLGLILNKIVAPIVLGLVFYLVVTPTGLVMRLAGKDPLSLKTPAGRESLRVASHTRDRDHMERPY